MGEQISLSVEQVNQAFVDASPYINPVISTRAKRYNKLWGKLIGRDTFKYGEGYVKSKWQYHGGTADQSSSRAWNAMTASTAPNPDTGAPGNSACRYEASVINYGLEQKQFTVYETLRRTEDLCLTDINFKFQVKQHIAAFMTTLGDVTLGEWETYTRDAYISMCQTVFLIEGLPSFSASFGMDSVSLTDVDVSQIGVLNQGVLDRFYQYLYREAPMGACGMNNTMPVFGIMSSPETLTSIIRDDDTRNTEQRYANPNFLLEGIGQTKEYQGWAHMADPQGIRYKMAADGTSLVRVFPFTESATTIGQKITVDQDYIDAPFELSLIYVKDVVKLNVPPANASIGSAKFDPIANYGEFFWQNIKDRDTNPLGEIGYWLSRFRAAPEPMDNSDRAYAILHRRNVGMSVVLPDSCDTSPVDTAVSVTSVSTTSLDDTYARVIVVLNECLNCDLGDTVTFDPTSLDHLGVITNYLGGTSYEITMASDADWVTALEAISSLTLQCGDQS